MDLERSRDDGNGVGRGSADHDGVHAGHSSGAVADRGVAHASRWPGGARAWSAAHASEHDRSSDHRRVDIHPGRRHRFGLRRRLDDRRHVNLHRAASGLGHGHAASRHVRVRVGAEHQLPAIHVNRCRGRQRQHRPDTRLATGGRIRSVPDGGHVAGVDQWRAVGPARHTARPSGYDVGGTGTSSADRDRVPDGGAGLRRAHGILPAARQLRRHRDQCVTGFGASRRVDRHRGVVCVLPASVQRSHIPGRQHGDIQC